MQKNTKQGFAIMDLETRTRIAALGGSAAHKAGTAHEWTPQEAKIAGRKGGRKSKNIII